jgi:hypothetical protein
VAARQFFVDESFKRDYILCAAVVADDEINVARKFMRDLKPGNRDRLHMQSESRYRGRIISEFVQGAVVIEAHIFVGGRPSRTRSQRDIRTFCLEALASYAAANDGTRILVESCSQDKQDRDALTSVLAGEGALGRVRVDVDTPTSHELLWAADLIAWAYAANGNTRQAVGHLVTVHDLR